MKKRVSRKSILVYPVVLFLVLALGGVLLSFAESPKADIDYNEIVREYGPDDAPRIFEEMSNESSSELISTLIGIGSLLAVVLVILEIHSYKWTVTDSGIEMKHGILPWSNHYLYYEYSDIYDIYSYRPKLKFLGWLLHYGTIAFSTTAGTTEEHSEKMMTFPNRFVSEATEALKNYRSGRTTAKKKTAAAKTPAKTTKKKTTAGTKAPAKTTKKKTTTAKTPAKTTKKKTTTAKTPSKTPAKTTKKKAANKSDIVEQLEQLAKLRKAGVIDETEFKKLKKKITG